MAGFPRPWAEMRADHAMNEAERWAAMSLEERAVEETRRKRHWAKVEWRLSEYVNLEPAYFVPLIDDQFDREVMLPGLIRSIRKWLQKIEHELGRPRGLRVVK